VNWQAGRTDTFFLMSASNHFLARVRHHPNGWNVCLRQRWRWELNDILPDLESAKAEAERLVLVNML
jgi:hypothetical protein